MVGIGGPPVFLLFKWLHTPKEEARATGVLMGMLSPRIALFWLSGLFAAQSTGWWVYALCVGSGLAGSVVGDVGFQHVDQARALLYCGVMWRLPAALR